MKSTTRRRVRSYTFSERRIRELLAVPVAQRLERLAVVNRFLDRAMTPEAKRVREMFRQGKLAVKRSR